MLYFSSQHVLPHFCPRWKQHLPWGCIGFLTHPLDSTTHPFQPHKENTQKMSMPCHIGTWSYLAFPFILFRTLVGVQVHIFWSIFKLTKCNLFTIFTVPNMDWMSNWVFYVKISYVIIIQQLIKIASPPFYSCSWICSHGLHYYIIKFKC